MPRELRLHPDRLRADAATAAGLVDELRRAAAGQVPAEDDRLRTRVLRATGELAELSEALAAAAAAAEEVDSRTARLIGRTP